MNVRHEGAAGQRRIDRADALCVAVLVTLTSLFFFSFFNRFAGIRSGAGEFTGGMALLAGKLPYRDYYTAGPPLNQIKSALELAIFGKYLIVTRAAAVVERLAGATLLYVWLRRYFGPVASMFASLTTIIASAGDFSDPLASYNHDAIFLAMSCGYAACGSLDAASLRRIAGWGALAGASVALSSLTKQTVGLATAATVLVVGVLCFSRRGFHFLLCWVASYLAGFAVPILAVVAFLRYLGVLGLALRMLFVSGPSAKAGHPLDFLFRAHIVWLAYERWVVMGLLSLALLSVAIWAGLRRERAWARRDAIRSAVVTLLIGVVLFGLCEYLTRTEEGIKHNIFKGAIAFTLAGVTIFGVALLVRGFLVRERQSRTWQLAMFASVSWAIAVALALSWPLFEAMLLPGLALLVAAALEGLQRTRWILYAALACMLGMQLRAKLDLPFSFVDQTDPPIRTAVDRSPVPMLRGMRLPPETVALLDYVTSVVQQRSKPTDTIFTYPEMGLFYVLTDRWFPTFAGSHNIDVVPDWFARAEAQRLAASRPAVILYAREPLGMRGAEEFLWRNGQPSGLRAMDAAVDGLIAGRSPGYVLTRTFQLDSTDDPIEVYVRADLLKGR